MPNVPLKYLLAIEAAAPLHGRMSAGDRLPLGAPEMAAEHGIEAVGHVSSSQAWDSWLAAAAVPEADREDRSEVRSAAGWAAVGR
jgi:hypothetical protein